MRLEVNRLDAVGDAFRSRSSYIQSKVNKHGNDLATGTNTRYEGGHTVGRHFGGPPEEINMVAMLGEVNQYRVGGKLKSYKRFEEQIAADPENFKNLVIEFKYPEPADSKVADTERVPTKFEATWVDANGKSTRRGFENVPAGKGE